MNSKSFIVVIVNNSISELDWIMPIIYSLKNRYDIFVYFKNSDIFESLKNNKTLFLLLMKVAKGYSIEKFYHLFLIKIIKKYKCKNRLYILRFWN